MQVVDLPGLNNIAGVWQAGPVVQLGSVVGVICLVLTFLGQFKLQHVHWQVELGLDLVVILLVGVVTLDPGCVGGQHATIVILNAEGSNVVATLVSEASLVFVLENWQRTCKCYLTKWHSVESGIF